MKSITFPGILKRRDHDPTRHKKTAPREGAKAVPNEGGGTECSLAAGASGLPGLRAWPNLGRPIDAAIVGDTTRACGLSASSPCQAALWVERLDTEVYTG